MKDFWKIAGRVLLGIIVIPFIIWKFVLVPLDILSNPAKDPITFWVIVFGLIFVVAFLIFEYKKDKEE